MSYMEEAIEQFSQIPPNWVAIGELFARFRFTGEELAEIAYEMADQCCGEYREFRKRRTGRGAPEAMHSAYLMKSLQLLLDHGLDPNAVADDCNVMWCTHWIDAPMIGASALRLLLECGGDPNHSIPGEGETLFEYLSGCVSFDDFSDGYETTVQCWLVLMAYGGCWKDGTIPLTMLGGNQAEGFKAFEKFDFSLERIPGEGKGQARYLMRIYDTETGEEVARYG